MGTVIRFFVRVFVVIAAAVFAASAAVAFVLLLGVWAVRAGWARLTGRPAQPFVVRVDPRGSFDRAYRGPRKIADVTDVEPKSPGG